MNILYLCDEYPPGPHGGIGTLVQLLARQMVKAGHRVVVAGLYSPGYGGADEFEDEGVKVYRYRWNNDGWWMKNRYSLQWRIANRVAMHSGFRDRDIRNSVARFKNQLEQLINKYEIAIAEIPDYNDYVRFCSIYIPFSQLSVPVVIKLNGSITYFNAEAGKSTPAYIRQMEQTLLQQAAAVSSASKYTADKTAEYFSYQKPITVLYNGINTGIDLHGIEKKQHQVIFTGALMVKKGIYQLMKAWNIVNKQISEARLLILGKGNIKPLIKLLNDEAKDSVMFLGHVWKDEVYQHLKESAVSVFPSYAEAFALAPLEAMACRTAVINANRTSGGELVNDGVDGLLIDPDNIEQIAASIIYLLQNPDIADRLAQKGNEKVKVQFSIEEITKQNINFYEAVISSAQTA